MLIWLMNLGFAGGGLVPPLTAALTHTGPSTAETDTGPSTKLTDTGPSGAVSS